MGISIKACVGNQWNNWTNSDENGRFQLYGLTPGVTYYLQVMGGCTFSQNGPGACYEPYSSAQYNAQDICSGAVDNSSLDPSGNDIVYVSSDVKFHRVTLREMPKSTGQIRVYVKSSSGYNIPNANVNINPDGTPWGKTPTSCASNDFSGYSSNPGFSNANINTSATGYALLDGLPSGNYNVNIWTPFSSGGNGPSSFNNGADGQFAFGNNSNGGGGNWQQAHCQGYGVDDYRVTVDTDPVTNGGQTMHVYNSSGTDVGLSSITYIVTAGGNATGEVKGTIRFSGLADLRETPVMITLYPQCAGTGQCGQGNFGVINSSGSDHYDYSISVASGAAYYMNVNSVGWGRVNRGGGDNTIHLESTGTFTVNMDFEPAGTISGTVYKPDGTVFTPTTNQYVSINASGNNGWAGTQLQKDGTFVMNNVLPGISRLSIMASGGTGTAFNYALPSPAPAVTVVVNSTATVNLNLVKANYVGVQANLSWMPDQTIIMNESNALLGFRVIPLPAGSVLKGETISKILTGSDEDGMRMRYAPASSGEGPCGQNWGGGFCAIGMPSPSVYDFYLMRAGDFAKSTGTVNNSPYPHFTLMSSSKSVIIDDAHATAIVHPGMGIGVSSGVLVNLTPATNMSGRGNATLSGAITAANFFRSSDYDATGGDFDKFVTYLPVVTLYDANGVFKAAGMVVPSPAFIAEHDKEFDSAFSQGYTAFKDLLDSAGSFGYEIRSLAPSTCYTAVLTTPNYPPYQSRVCSGADGSNTMVSINLDDAVGAGATLQGVVTSTDTSVTLANVEVQISGESVDTKSVVTNSSGAYKFEGLPQGTVRIKATMSGYALGEVEKDLSGTNTVTQNFALISAPGSITGTVYSQKLPFAKVQPGALIYAYDDTYNGTHDTVPLLKTMTGADGTYTLTGLVDGDVYKIFLKVPGKYTLKLSTVATSGIISGMDFTMLAKPLDIEIFAKRGESFYEFTVLNPQDFREGSAKWSASPYNAVSAVDLPLEKLSSGELRGNIPLTSLTAGITYVLRGDATSYSNKTVTKEILFGKDYKGNSEQNIDDIILGDDSEDATGRKNNEASMDQSGDDPSALVVPAGTMQTSTAAIPSCTFQGEDAGSSAVADKVAALGADAFAGNLYTIALTSVTLNDDKSFEVTLAYDKSTADLNDLSVAQYNDTTAAWENVPGVATINPVKGTVKVKLKKLASVLSVKGRPSYSVASFDGHEYAMKPLAAAPATTSGTFAVIKPSVAGGAYTGAKLKVFNVPNPFNLDSKSVATTYTGAQTTAGTLIHVEVPSANSGPGHIRIYTLAGELVKDISVTFVAGQHNYVNWDGKNKGGREVANGVYYGIVELSGKSPNIKDATFKMAVIK